MNKITFAFSNMKLTHENIDENVRTILDDAVIDPLVRICFSKMRGNLQKFCSRRTSAVTFVCTSLPSEKSVPKLVDLILKNINDVIREATTSEAQDSEGYATLDLTQLMSQLPDEGLCRGVLTSVDAVLRHGWGSLPYTQCRQIAVALVLVLIRSKTASQAQMIRSDALNHLASMMENKSTPTLFVCPSVVQLTAEMSIAPSGAESVTSGPALQKFLASCFKSRNRKFIMEILVSHK